MRVPEPLRRLHESIWREVYLSADILDDLQDGDLDLEPHRLLAPLTSMRGLARVMDLARTAPQPSAVLTILARTIEELVQAQATDLAPESAHARQLVVSLESRTGATLGGMLEMLAGFSPGDTTWSGHYCRWGRQLGAALQWRSDLDAATEAGPGSNRWRLLMRTLEGLGLEQPAPDGMVLATVRLRLVQLRDSLMGSLTATQPAEVVSAFEEALQVALDLRLAERRLECRS